MAVSDAHSGTISAPLHDDGILLICVGHGFYALASLAVRLAEELSCWGYGSAACRANQSLPARDVAGPVGALYLVGTFVMIVDGEHVYQNPRFFRFR